MAERRRGPLPLESTDWWPLEAAVERRLQQTGSKTLTENDLNEALARRRQPLRSRATHVASGHREQMSFEEWADLIKVSIWSDGPHVVERQQRPPRGGMQIVRPVRGFVFHCWKPDFKKIFADDVSTPMEPEQVPENSKKTRGRPREHN